MKIVKKVLKTLCLFIISSLLLYLIFTIFAFIGWCNENQINVANHSDDLLVYLDPNTIEGIGKTVGTFAQSIEDSSNDPYSIANYYDPLGFSVWAYMNSGLQYILTKYFTISILLGFSIAFAYLVITSKKIHYVLKFAIGYLTVILIVPFIYMYSYTYRFWSISETFRSMPKYFFIIYTAVFILMYLANYFIGVKMTKDLNNTIKNTSI